jgi:Na+/proline symporter
VRKQYQETMKAAGADANDTNYIFLRFVYDHFPAGLMGLLIAIIFLAAWGSIAAALNALAGATMVDFYCRLKNEPIAATCDDPAVQQRQYGLGKWITFGWGIFCIGVAMVSNRLGSLIEAVNILGSLFYGVILGIFLVAFYLKKVGGKAVFMAAILGEAIVILLFYLNEKGTIGLSFLWLNAVGALVVILLAVCAQAILPKPARSGP